MVRNLAERVARGGIDFARLLRIALGSALELEAQSRLFNDLHSIGPSDDPIPEQATEVQ